MGRPIDMPADNKCTKPMIRFQRYEPNVVFFACRIAGPYVKRDGVTAYETTPGFGKVLDPYRT